MGLNATLYTAGRSLELFSAGIQVAGQNVSNATTAGYVREELQISTASPYQSGGLLFGTGAQADGIRQQIDLFLESQIHLANGDVKSAEARSNGYAQLELIIGELGDTDLSSRLNEFLSALNEAVNQPELTANRQLVLQAGEELANSISTMREQIDRVRNSTNSGVQSLVDEANELIQQISSLNSQIVKMESGGLLKSDAGGLRTQRLTALNRLSEIMPIQTVQRENGMIDVFSGNDFLVIQGTVNQLETYREVDQGVAVDFVRFTNTQNAVAQGSGELSGVIEARDNVLGGFVGQLDLYAQSVIQEMNRLHASGEGVAGYTDVTGTYAVTDDAVALNQAGLAGKIQHGSFEIKIYDQNSGTTKTTQINIDLDGLGGNDTTLTGLQSMLDGITNLSATIDTSGRLNLSADEGYEIRFSNDTSGTLAALGINTFFQGSDSYSIAINQTLKSNPDLLATGTGGGAGDNSNIVKLATFMDNPSELLGGLTLDQFYEQATSQVAQASKAETSIFEGYTSFQASLLGQRQQISGVSLDEEAIRIMELQHGYAAAARIISTVEELFNTLVNI